MLFILSHGSKASGENSILDGVSIEAQLQSLGVNAASTCRVAEPWVACRLLLTSASSPPPASKDVSFIQSGFFALTRKALLDNDVRLQSSQNELYVCVVYLEIRQKNYAGDRLSRFLNARPRGSHLRM